MNTSDAFTLNLELVEIVVLQQPDVIEPALHHRVRTGLAVLVQEVLFQRSRIHPDPDRTAVVLGRLHHLAHPSADPILPGLIRRQAAPASAASIARL